MKKIGSSGLLKHEWTKMAWLAGAIFFAYAGVLNAGFMSWDDPEYVSHPDVRSGISPALIYRWFSSTYVGNYQPLVIFSYALDHLIGGDDPAFYHFQNIFWHIMATLLVYSLVNRLQESRWIGFFVALLFAIHPVQTESVSWIAARNKSMNAVFYFSAMIVYCDYVRTAKLKLLLFAWFFGVVAFICKSTALALPIALFAVDIWLGRRFKGKAIWLEKLPLVLAGVPVVMVTLSAQDDFGFLHRHGDFSGTGVIFAGYAFFQYVLHLFFPVDLSAWYPYPKSIEITHLLSAMVAAVLLFSAIVAYRKKHFLWAGGALFFTSNLLPVLQLLQFGETLMADRYLYIAGVGLWYPLVVVLIGSRNRTGHPAGYRIVVAICVVLLVMTISRNRIWLNEINFWSAVARRFPGSQVAHYSLGAAYLKAGDVSSAEKHMDRSVLCDAASHKAWYNKASLCIRQGKINEALDALNRSIGILPYPKALLMRAMVFHSQGNYLLSMKDISEVLSREPANARAYCLKADCEEQLGKPEEALRHYGSAIACDDREPLFFIRRGMLQARRGDKRAALRDLDKAVAMNPGDGEPVYYRALMRYSLGQSPCDDLRMALENGYARAGEMLREVCR
jgi:protein O-mannosyl-transferase